jgi:hypothetical protein
MERSGIRTLGALPGALPPLSHPDFSLENMRKLLAIAVAVTVLGLTEAISIARAIALKSGQRIDGNQEFIGQGLSNIVASFFSGYPSSASFNRSGLNYEAGARTPLAAACSALFLVAVLLAVAPLVAYLPIASMAAILFLVAWGLFDFHSIRGIIRASRPKRPCSPPLSRRRCWNRVRHPRRGDAVAHGLPQSHLAADDADPGSGHPARGPQYDRSRARAQRMPAAEDPAHRGFDLFRRGQQRRYALRHAA